MRMVAYTFWASAGSLLSSLYLLGRLYLLLSTGSSISSVHLLSRLYLLWIWWIAYIFCVSTGSSIPSLYFLGRLYLLCICWVACIFLASAVAYMFFAPGGPSISCGVSENLHLPRSLTFLSFIVSFPTSLYPQTWGQRCCCTQDQWDCGQRHMADCLHQGLANPTRPRPYSTHPHPPPRVSLKTLAPDVRRVYQNPSNLPQWKK